MITTGMDSNEQWTISSRAIQIRQNRRRERAQRLHMQAQQRECVGSPQGSLEGIISNSHNTGGGLQSRVPSFSNPLYIGSNEDEEDSEASCSEDNLKVHTKIRNKNKSNTNKQLTEPLYEEDVIDGFAIISFSSYDELETAARIVEKTSCLPDPLVPLDTKDRVRQSVGQRVSKPSGRISNGVIKGRCKSAKNSAHSTPSSTSQHQNGPSCNNESGAAKLIESNPAADGGGSRDTRATSVDRFSDVSRHSNSSRGYLCDSESEDTEKAQTELRGESPASVNRGQTEFVAPNKQRAFSPAHASSSHNSSASIENHNLRWVGLSGSPRPATAVAPHGHFQNGPPRLSDCQPTEGGAGPSPAPPAAPSPRLPPQPVGGSPLSTFHSSIAASSSSATSSSPHSHPLNPLSAPVIRSAVHGFMPHAIPYSASPSTCQPSAPSLSAPGQVPISYVTPPFYSSGPRPLSTDSDSKSGVVDVQKQPQPSQHSYKLPPPPPPTFPPLSTAPVTFVAAMGSAPVLTTSSFPFFPPVSMMNRTTPSNSSTSGGMPCFVAPSPPSTKPLMPVNAFGEQTFGFSRPSMSAPPSAAPPSAAPLPRAALTETSPSTSRPVNLVVSNSQSREPSSSSTTSSSSTSGSRPQVNLPFQPHPSARRSPSLPPSSAPSAFPTPVSWPRPPHPNSTRQSPIMKRPSDLSPNVRPSGRHSPQKVPSPLANVRAPGAGVSSQMGTDSYSDMLRRELDSRFLNSTPGLGGLLPPQLGGAPSGSPNLYRPIMPTMGLPGMSPFPPHSSSYTTVSSASLPSNSSAPPSSGNMMGHLSGMSAPSASLSSLPSKSKPGKWNATHVRIAWEIYQNQQRATRDPQHPDLKKKFSLTPKLNLTGNNGLANNNPQPPVLNMHNPIMNFPHHNMAGFIPRHTPSVPSQQSPHPLPHPAEMRSSPAPDQWNRLPRASPAPMAAPWLTPLVKAGQSASIAAFSSIKVDPSAASSSSSSSNVSASHHLLMKERERQKKEERDREREKEKERERERERERDRNERLEREKERERERERERRRHASRSPIHMRTASNGQMKNDGMPKSNASLSGNTIPPMASFHHAAAGMQQPAGAMPSAAMLDRSRMAMPMHSLYGQSFDPFRDVLRGMDPVRESMDREQRDYMRYAPTNPIHPGAPGLPPSMYHAAAAAAAAAAHGNTADRYRDFVGMSAGLAGDRYAIPPHLNHLAGSLGLNLASPQSAALNDRYREGLLAGSLQGSLPGSMGGMGGAAGMSGAGGMNVSAGMYPPSSASYQFSGMGLGQLGQSLAAANGLNSMSMLPPSLMSSGDKRTPPSQSTPHPAGSMRTNQMGLMMPPSMGIPPYPMPSPSPMLNPHMLPPLGSSMNSGGRPPSTSPVARSLMDLTSHPHHPPGLTSYNPLDYPRKDDPQSR